MPERQPSSYRRSLEVNSRGNDISVASSDTPPTTRGDDQLTSTLDRNTPPLEAIKQRQQQAWASGDFAVVAARIVLVAEQLCDAADLHAGWRVLDVATGSG